jgi:hypothetical protein
MLNTKGDSKCNQNFVWEISADRCTEFDWLRMAAQLQVSLNMIMNLPVP